MRLFEKKQTVRPSRHGVFLVAAGLAMTLGCDNPDPQGRFDEFGAKTTDRRGSPDLGPVEGGQQVDFSGSYLLSLATTLAPAAPIYMETTVTVDTDAWTIDFVFQPLKTDLDGGMPRADARTPIGDPIIANGVPLSEDGDFEVDLGTVEVDGSANPISGGDIVALIQLQGTVLGTSEFCGAATGDVTAPTMLPLAGSTFGTVPIDGEDLTLLDPVGRCPAGAVPTPDMGMDAGGDMGGDMGAPAYIRCPAGLEGDYDLVFKADISMERTQLTMALTAGDGMNTPCYTGTLISQLDDTTVVGNVDFVDDADGVLTAFVPDFMIPPGATPILPDGGVASLEMRATAWNNEGACGELTFALAMPAISSEGGFAMIRRSSADFTLDATLANATCTAIVPNVACGLDAWAGTYQYKFITETTANLGGEPSVVEMTLEPHPLTCLSGSWASLLDPTVKLADVAGAVAVAPDQAEITVRNFTIPPNPENPIPFLRDGGVADVVMTSTTATPGTSFCGTADFVLITPASITSAATFAADQTEPTDPACP